MAIELDIDVEYKIVAIKIKGQSSMQEVAEAYAEVFKHPGFEFNMDAYWDISGVNVTSYSIAEFRTLTGLLGQYRGQRGNDYRVALVTNRTRDRQLLKLYSALLRLVGSFRMRVFDSGQDGLNWLRTLREAS